MTGKFSSPASRRRVSRASSTLPTDDIRSSVAIGTSAPSPRSAFVRTVASRSATSGPRPTKRMAFTCSARFSEWLVLPHHSTKLSGAVMRLSFMEVKSCFELRSCTATGTHVGREHGHTFGGTISCGQFFKLAVRGCECKSALISATQWSPL
eukprot:2415721-Rhodomonas_salina.2